MTAQPTLKLRKFGIDTYRDPIIYMRQDCHVCRSEGLEAHARVKVTLGGQSIIATLNTVSSDVLAPGEAVLSDYAWRLLNATEGAEISISHARPLTSLSHVRSKIYGNSMSHDEMTEVITDIAAGLYSDIHIAAFITACAGGRMNAREIADLTQAMVAVGKRIDWGRPMVVDKHCVGGLPGNRTTPIVVSIVAAAGLTMPKTSSRAITSPAGTADTMEVLAPVDLSIADIRKVVEQENGCIVWGGSSTLSPADDILIRVEKALDLDSEGQMVASVLSKKIAAGSNHLLIDIPVGPTAKVRDPAVAEALQGYFTQTSAHVGLQTTVVFSDGTQPVGRGIGPALEARDVVAVLRGDAAAPQDLRARALTLAGRILEFEPTVASAGNGLAKAQQLLDSGAAWRKFQAICEAQGGMRKIPTAAHQRPWPALQDGIVTGIDNRRIALLAKLAGAPQDKVAGVDLHTPLGTHVTAGQPLFTVHAHSKGELDYALSYLAEGNHIVGVSDS